MKFRPCIDIHNGKVKQMVGGSLTDCGGKENFISDHDAAFYAELYRRDQLTGGHLIMLNPPDSPFAQANREQALKACHAFPGGLQVGGGITAENAGFWIDQGASHVIVTSYLFHDGALDRDRLKKLTDAVGKSKLVLDLSCRKKGEDYWIVTDRWQRFTSMRLQVAVLEMLAEFCDEFLIHAVDVEGRSSGIDAELASLLGEFEGIPVTYAGGVRSREDIRLLERLGHGRVDFTVGSALDLFGGHLKYSEMARMK